MDLNDFIRQSIQEVLTENGNPGQTGQPAPAPAAPQPITVNIQGQPVTFRDQADLEAQLNATAAALRAQNEAPAPAPAPAPTGSRVSNDEDGGGFDNAEYIRLMNEDPRKATNYALSHVLFDGKIDDPASVIRESLVQQAAVTRQLAAYQFKDAHREVPLEDPRVGNTLIQVREQLGLPFTAQGLDAAYAYAIQKNLLPDFRAMAAQNQGQGQGQPQSQPAPQQVPNVLQFPQQNQWQQPQAPTNPYLAPPPAGGRSASFTAPISLDDVENLSTDQLASLLRKLDAAGVPTGPAV